MVPSKWYPLLAQDTCVINRSGLQNLLGLSIICKLKNFKREKKGIGAVCVYNSKIFAKHTLKSVNGNRGMEVDKKNYIHIHTHKFAYEKHISYV